MIDRKELEALRDRLAKATGPSVELDVRLFLALQDKQVMVIDDTAGRYPRPHRYVSARTLWHDAWPHWSVKSQAEAAARELECPAYTASIDAAVTLRPEFISYEMSFSAAGDGALRRVRWWDWRRSPRMLDPSNHWEATAATLPLAFCLARVEYELTKVPA